MSDRVQNAGDLARVVSHEESSDWPQLVEIVAYWGPGRSGRRRSIEIPADKFFGTGRYGAPISGSEIIGMVDKLRREGTKTRK